MPFIWAGGKAVNQTQNNQMEKAWKSGCWATRPARWVFTIDLLLIDIIN